MRIVGRERRRIARVWKACSAALLDVVKSKFERDVKFNADDFAAALAGLGAELVNNAAYDEAAEAGANAVGEESTIDWRVIALRNSQRVSRYAKRVPGRIALNLAQFLNDTQAGETDLSTIYETVNAKLEALGADVTRYAEPPWGVGNEAYGRQLGDFDIMVDWMLDEGINDHCDDCITLSNGGPYSSETLPTWPKHGDTACLDRCYCSIIADDETWRQHFPQAA